MMLKTLVTRKSGCLVKVLNESTVQGGAYSCGRSDGITN